LAADDVDGALLLAGVEPGESVAQTGWKLSDVVPVLSDLRGTSGIGDGSFPSVEERVRFLIQLTRTRRERRPTVSGVLGIDLGAVEDRAIALARSYEGTPHLVHGDLHPGNVLRSATDGAVAIDPRACVGDPHFDLADWVLGPALPRDVELRERADELGRSVPGVDPDRAYAWAVALAPVLACSVARDHSPEAQQRARALAAIRG
jgi:streptomycin 6-kinase